MTSGQIDVCAHLFGHYSQGSWAGLTRRRERPAVSPPNSSRNARLNGSGESRSLKLVGVRGQVDVLRALEGRNTSAGRCVALAERWDVETKAADPFAKSGLGQPAPAPGWPKAVAAVAIAVIVATRFAVLAVGSRELVIGSSARQHRHALGRMPAPQHPRTAGRPRTRAPTQSITVT